MKFWVYAIDWRSMAIEIIAECASERKAIAAQEQYVAGLTKSQLMEMVSFKTIARTPASDDMQAAVEQFKRLSGRVAG